MGRIVEKVKFTNFETGKSIETEALIDTGATMVVLPQDLVDELGLRKLGELTVRYGNNKTEVKPVYRAVEVEIKGRSGDFDAVAEPEGSTPLIGQLVLQQLDFLVDPSTESVIPNPRSPDMPMVELL